MKTFNAKPQKRLDSKKIISVLFAPLLLCALALISFPASASNVTFEWSNFLGQPTTNITFIVIPVALQTNGPSLAPLDPITTNTANSASLTLSGMLSGSYTIRHNSTVFNILVPNDSSTYNATNLLSALAPPGATSIYTRYQSDQRYPILTNDAITLDGVTALDGVATEGTNLLTASTATAFYGQFATLNNGWTNHTGTNWAGCVTGVSGQIVFYNRAGQPWATNALSTNNVPFNVGDQESFQIVSGSQVAAAVKSW